MENAENKKPIFEQHPEMFKCGMAMAGMDIMSRMWDHDPAVCSCEGCIAVAFWRANSDTYTKG